MAGASEVGGDARYRLLYELGVAFAAHLEPDELFFPWVASEDPEVVRRLRTLRLPADRGIPGEVFGSGRAVRVADVATDVRFYGEVDRRTGATTPSSACSRPWWEASRSRSRTRRSPPRRARRKSVGARSSARCAATSRGPTASRRS